MAVVCKPALAVPDHVVTKQNVLDAIPEVFDGHPRLRTLLSIAENSGIERRHFAQPLDSVVTHPGVDERNRMYCDAARALGTRAALDALENASISAADVDLIITVSCTGFMIPSLDAHLLNTLDFDSNTRRLPISQLGCAAGAAAIGRAFDYCRAYPNANVLIVAAEFSSLCFQPSDRSLSAAVAALLFGDGVAATVVRGSRGTGFDVVATGSHFLPNTEHFMGFELKETGFHIILDRAVPQAIETQIAPAFTDWLFEHHITIPDLDFLVMHPGGPRVMDEVVRCLDVDPDMLASSRKCFSEVGNLSSASVLAVLRNVFESQRPGHEEVGFLASFGPGFSVEMSLGRWLEE